MELTEKTLPALRRLLPEGSRVIVAVSGGPDSQALLHLLATLAPKLGLREVLAVGIDHGLRAAAAAELELAHALARRLGVRFSSRRVEVETRGNILENARIARYRSLFACAAELAAARVAVAHNANDQAETVLFRLARGASLRGAAGMPERRGQLVRPLLSATRADILAYLAYHGVSYATDPSNADPRRARTRIRTEVLPVLCEINQGAIDNICRFAARARRAEARLLRAARARMLHNLGPRCELGLCALEGELAARVLLTWFDHLGLCGATERDAARVLALAREGAEVTVRRRRIVLSRRRLWPCSGAWQEGRLACPGRMAIEGLGIVFEARVEAVDDIAAWRTWCSPTRVAFDADQIQFPLVVRGVAAGDRIELLGGRGSTKVGDLFTNLKVPRPLRAGWPLLLSGGEVVWVAGLRRSARAPLAKDTKRVLQVAVEGELPLG